MTSKAVALARMRDIVRNGEARELRLRSGLSLREVGSDIGVDAAAVHRWENGTCLPRGPHALRYARLLNVLQKAAR